MRTCWATAASASSPTAGGVVLIGRATGPSRSRAARAGHDRLPGRGSVEAAARLPGNHDRLSVAQNDRRLAPVHVDLLRDHAELALEGGRVGASGRVDIGAEQPELQALEPPERHRSVPAVDGRHRRGAPIAADGELRRGDRPAAAGPREDDRLRGERMGPCVELGLSLGCGEAADVLTRDRDAVGDHVRGPGVGEAHDEHSEQEDSDEGGDRLPPAPDHGKTVPPRTGPPALTDRTDAGLRPHRRVRL